MKICMFLINTIYWLTVFIVPAAILGVAGWWLFLDSNNNLLYAILLWITGFILGILLAERVRKKYGLDNFFGRLSATPDIDGENILDDRKKDDAAKSEICNP